MPRPIEQIISYNERLSSIYPPCPQEPIPLSPEEVLVVVDIFDASPFTTRVMRETITHETKCEAFLGRPVEII